MGDSSADHSRPHAGCRNSTCSISAPVDSPASVPVSRPELANRRTVCLPGRRWRLCTRQKRHVLPPGQGSCSTPDRCWREGLHGSCKWGQCTWHPHHPDVGVNQKQRSSIWRVIPPMTKWVYKEISRGCSHKAWGRVEAKWKKYRAEKNNNNVNDTFAWMAIGPLQWQCQAWLHSVCTRWFQASLVQQLHSSTSLHRAQQYESWHCSGWW